MKRTVFYRVILTIAIAVLMIYANFIVVNRAGRYAVEADFYNKLSVAYNLKGEEGVREVIKETLERGKPKRQLAAAKETEKELLLIKDLKGYIEKSINDRTNHIFLLINLRRSAFVLILIFVILKFFIGFKNSRKP